MKSKVISSILLMIVFICSLFCGKLIFNITMSIIAILALRELLHIRSTERRLPIELEVLTYVLTIFFVMNNYSGYLDFYLVDYKLIASLILVELIPLVLINDKKKYGLLDALYLIGSTLFIGITFNLLTQFRSYDINYIVYIFLIALVTEVFGYITTIYIGKRKLLPTIISKRTVEGEIGGLFMGTVVSTLFFISVIPTKLPVYAIFIISFILSLLSQLGDLVFSFIKKEFNKKEFSNYYVVNSGILDLIDSVIFITLGFILFVSII